MIEVTPKGEGVYRVVVSNGSSTRHEVTVPGGYAETLTGGEATEADLVERSFEFLLAREPASSILASFELPVIARYFPEYEEAMRANYGASQ